MFAPRLNAPGRIAETRVGAGTPVRGDEVTAGGWPRSWKRANEQRKDQTDVVQKDAFTRSVTWPTHLRRGGIVLAEDHWDEGVVGIAAARVAEEFGRPTILLSVQGELAKGSGRSIRGVDLKKHMDGLQEMFVRTGDIHRRSA